MASYYIFSGSSHPAFAEEVGKCLKVKPGKIHFEPFPDHELSLEVLDNVRGRDVFLIQTIAKDPNNYLMELLIMIDAMKRASAKSIVAVIPYFGYARQDRKDKPRTPITAKLVANLLTQAGADRIVTMDLHAAQIQGFFDIPVDHLFARPLLCQAVEKLKLKQFVVIAPDLGAIKRARYFADHLKADFAVIDKRRISTQKVEVYSVIGDVADKDVILVDDMCSTGGTLVSGALACKAKGAKRIFAAVTHGLFVLDSIERLVNSPIEKIFTSNSVPLSISHDKIVPVSVASLFAEAIQCILSKESVSSLFD